MTNSVLPFFDRMTTATPISTPGATCPLGNGKSVTWTKYYNGIITPHRMHDMHTIAIDDPVAWASVTRLHCANTTERIEVLFGVETLGHPRNIRHKNIRLSATFDADVAKVL